MVKCMECMDAGYRMYDGTPSPCPNCDAGAAFEQRQRDPAGDGDGRLRRDLRNVPRSDLNPMLLPPGGDVMITEMKRQAAGLPVGVIGSDVLVRAQVESQPLVHELVRVLDDFARDVPGTAERAVEVLAALPQWAVPDDVRDRKDPTDAEPVEEPEGQVLPLETRKRAPGKPQGDTSAAPLEPPTE